MAVLPDEFYDAPPPVVAAIVPFSEEEKRIKVTRLFKAPLDTLSLDEQIEALAALKRVDSYLNSSAKKSPGRLRTLTDSIRGLMVDTRRSLVLEGAMKAGETYTVKHAGVELMLTGGTETKTPNPAKVEALAKTIGDDAFNVAYIADIERIFELNREGVISNDVLATIVTSRKTPSFEKITALKTLGKISEAEFEAVYDTETTNVALKVS